MLGAETILPAPSFFAYSPNRWIRPVAAPKQRISCDHALSAITLESAYVIEKENELGSIKPGKVADFTILEQDPHTVPVEELKNIPVWGVVFEGKKVEAPKQINRTTVLPVASGIPEATDFTDLAKTCG